jgi:hypothetical protein
MSSPTIGVVEWFRPGEYQQLNRCLQTSKQLG